MIVTLGACAALAYLPVTEYLDLRAERAAADQRGDELDQELIDAQADVARAQAAVAERALCFNRSVRPGLETYSVSGIRTCVE